MDVQSDNDNNRIVDCPHVLQERLRCNDETAKELARLVYEIATDYEIRKALENPVERLKARFGLFPDVSEACNDFIDILANYGMKVVFKRTSIRLRRNVRPATAGDGQTTAKTGRLFRAVKHDSMIIPIDIPDVIRAFGEFADVEIRLDVTIDCGDYYDDPEVGCDACRRKYKTE